MSDEIFVMDPLNYDINDIIFEKSIISTPEFPHSVIKIKTKTPNHKEGKLIFKLDRCYSSGIKNININNSKKALAIQLYDSQGNPSKSQLKMEELLNKIVIYAKLYLASNDIKLPEPDYLSPIFYYSKQETDLYLRNLQYIHKYIQYEINNNNPSFFMFMKHHMHKYFNCKGLSSLEISNNEFSNKIQDKVNAVIHDGTSNSNKNPYTSPVLHLNLKTSKKSSSLFIDEDTNMEVDPLLFIDNPCFVTCAISMDSINIGKSTNSISIILEECIIKLKEKVVIKKTRLLKNI
jgi:hypothetical protein